MANQKPYYTSTDLIEAVKRKISIPLSQQTFSENDILLFANEETYLSQVPSILLYHQEYFVFPVVVPLKENTSRYPIPDRAIGLRMRDVMYQDQSGNLSDMTRVDAADKAFFQQSGGSTTSIHKFYIEGNEIVLLPKIEGSVFGSIVFYIFLRPNQLVANNRAAILQSIATTPSQIKKNLLANSTFIQINPTNTFTIPLHGFSNGNHLTFQSSGILPAGMLADTLYYVVGSTTNTFQISSTIGGPPIILTSVGTGIHTVTRTKSLKIGFKPGDLDFTTGTITALNHDLVNNDRVLLSSDKMLPTPLAANTFYYVVGATSNTIQLSATLGGPPIVITYNGEGSHYISTDITTLTFDQVPVNITNSSLIDFLQTNTGHRTYNYDVQIPSNGISGMSISFNSSDIPTSFGVNDYICTANECIIPQIPSDLHNGLAERTSARILASIGDAAGLAAVQQKISEIDKSQGSLLDNRAEGNPQKVLARHSLLRYQRFTGRRRL